MEENVKYQISPKEGTEVIVIREGEAIPVREPLTINVAGNIDSVALFIANRTHEQNKSLIIVNRDAMSIELLSEPENYFGAKITGKLQLSTEFLKWNINKPKTYTAGELADFIKMNRAFFEKKEQANKLVSELRNFVAKVTGEIEEKDNKRGNVDSVRRQVVDSNLPESFVLKLPIFKGQKPQKLTIEVNVEPKTLECYLISAEAEETITETKDQLIDVEIDKLKGFCIIEQ